MPGSTGHVLRLWSKKIKVFIDFRHKRGNAFLGIANGRGNSALRSAISVLVSIHRVIEDDVICSNQFYALWDTGVEVINSP